MVTPALALLLACTGAASTGAGSKDSAGPGDSAADSASDSAGDSADTADTGAPDTGDTGPADGPDDDGDGYTDASHGGDDCDDADARVFPGATDWCDGLDQDCDGDPVGDGMCSQLADPDDSASLVVWGGYEGELAYGLLGADAPFDASPGGETLLLWLGWEDTTGGWIVGYLPGSEAWAAPEVRAAGWRGYQHDPLSAGFSGGDIDGDGYTDMWAKVNAGDDAYDEYVVVPGPHGGGEPGLVDLWDLASGSYKNTSAAYDGGHFGDAGADLDGDGRADAIISLSPRDADFYTWRLALGADTPTSRAVDLAPATPYVTVQDASVTGHVHFVRDLDGDGQDDLLTGVDCDGDDGIGLVTGPDLLAAAGASAAVESVTTPLCPATGGTDWTLPDFRDFDDRATDLDGDGLPDPLATADDDDDASEDRLAFIDLSLSIADGGRIAERGAYFGGGLSLRAAWYSGTDAESWLAVGYDGSCLYPVSGIPLGGQADLGETPAPCMIDDQNPMLWHVADLDHDDLPEWIWSQYGYIAVVRGFDVPFDDPSKW